MDKEKTESTAEHKQLQTFAEDAKDLFLLRQAKAEDDGTRISLAEVEARLDRG